MVSDCAERGSKSVERALSRRWLRVSFAITGFLVVAARFSMRAVANEQRYWGATIFAQRASGVSYSPSHEVMPVPKRGRRA